MTTDAEREAREFMEWSYEMNDDAQSIAKLIEIIQRAEQRGRECCYSNDIKYKHGLTVVCLECFERKQNEADSNYNDGLLRGADRLMETRELTTNKRARSTLKSAAEAIRKEAEKP